MRRIRSALARDSIYEPGVLARTGLPYGSVPCARRNGNLRTLEAGIGGARGMYWVQMESADSRRALNSWSILMFFLLIQKSYIEAVRRSRKPPGVCSWRCFSLGQGTGRGGCKVRASHVSLRNTIAYCPEALIVLNRPASAGHETSQGGSRQDPAWCGNPWRQSLVSCSWGPDSPLVQEAMAYGLSGPPSDPVAAFAPPGFFFCRLAGQVGRRKCQGRRSTCSRSLACHGWGRAGLSAAGGRVF